MIEKCFRRGQSPDKNDDAEDNPRRPRFDYGGTRVAVLGARGAIGFVAFESPDSFGMPEQQQNRDSCDGADGCDDIDEPGAVKI